MSNLQLGFADCVGETPPPVHVTVMDDRWPSLEVSVTARTRADAAWAVAFEHALALQCELAGGHEGQMLGYDEPTPAMTKAAKAWADDVVAAARKTIE